MFSRINPRQKAVKTRHGSDVKTCTHSSAVNVYSVLFAFRTIVTQPIDMNTKPGRSYFALKRSLRMIIAKAIATRIPRQELAATKVMSRNGSADK